MAAQLARGAGEDSAAEDNLVSPSEMRRQQGREIEERFVAGLRYSSIGVPTVTTTCSDSSTASNASTTCSVLSSV